MALRFDLVIRGGTVVNGSCCKKVDIGITDGLISVLALQGILPTNDGQKEIDATGKFVIPGVVDSHVHLREPGFTEKEDFVTGTKAAAAGGVTTVMVMPFTQPLVTSSKELEEKYQIADGRAFVDYTLQATVKPDLLEQVADATKWGVTSFEIFLAESPKELCICNNVILSSILERVAEAGKIVGIYADDDSIIRKNTEALKAAGRHDFMAYTESKPPVGEALGVARACLIAESVGVKIHFRQISTKIALDILRYMKKRYDRISVEVSPHHLFLDADSINSREPFAKVSPPLRKLEDCQALQQGLKDGTIDIIATDHAPHMPEEKETGYEDIWCAPGGIIGLQTLLPLMLDRVSSGFLSLAELINFLCKRPAELFGLYPRKGIIRVGSDADLVIIDLERNHTVSSELQYSKAKYTPFEGTKLRGMPVLTLLRGNVIMEDGIVLQKPLGQLVKPV